MEYMAVRDLRSSKEFMEKLAQDGEMVLTNNGKPTALLINVDSSNLEETVSAYRQSKAMRLLNDIRLSSVRNGTSEMSMDEIDAEVAAARKEAAAGRAGND